MVTIRDREEREMGYIIYAVFVAVAVVVGVGLYVLDRRLTRN